MLNRIKNLIMPIAICIGVTIFIWLAIFGDQGFYDLHKTINMKKELQNRIAEKKGKIEQLKVNKELLNDPDHLELVIRQELSYVKEGEIVFQQISP